MQILYLIPARGGSKGIPGKNIRPLAGKPLILHTVEAALGIASIDDICVSTDSPEIISVVERAGVPVPFTRPPEFATDAATTESVIQHALQFYRREKAREFDLIVLLQPTSPLRVSRQVREAILMFRKDIDMVVSVKETKANPYYLLMEEDGEGLLRKSKEGTFTRRQDCPKVYELNGAIYVMDAKKFEQGGMASLSRRIKYVMDDLTSVDIDDELDWLVAEAVIRKNA